MPTAIPVELLEVIGYADSRDSGMLPSIVPPVFRIREQPDRILVPPYALNAGFLCGASEIDGPEIQELHNATEVVLFNNHFPARTDFELWIDESNAYHYETRAGARSKLQQFANQSIKDAKGAFKVGHFAESERFCSSAISADDKCLDAFVIKAAIRHREEDEDGERLMARLISPYLDELSFARLVDDYSPGNQVGLAAHRGPRVPPMRAIATYRAAA